MNDMQKLTEVIRDLCRLKAIEVDAVFGKELPEQHKSLLKKYINL